MSILYYSPGGDTEREIEPYYLIFKWTSWYVYGCCLLRNDFRLFKLNRMDSITHVASYERNREVPLPDLSSEKVFPAKDQVKALFDPSMKWQLVEEYGVDSFTEQDDGISRKTTTGMKFALASKTKSRQQMLFLIVKHIDRFIGKICWRQIVV